MDVDRSIKELDGAGLKREEISHLPVVIAGHLLHDLAVDLIPEGVVFSGRTKDLVSKLDMTLQLSGGVISHVLQDRCTEVKEKQ